jgi:hypothetical protein
MILVVPKKSLTQADKKNLLKKGYVVVECEKPESVRLLSPETMVDKSDLFLAALSAIRAAYPTNGSEKFVDNLYKRLVPDKKVPVISQKRDVADKQKEEKKTILKEPIKKY